MIISKEEVSQSLVDAFACAIHQIRNAYGVYDPQGPIDGYDDALYGVIFVRKEISAAFDGVCDGFMDKVVQAVKDLERQT